MAINYSKAVNFAAKDTLASGDPLKACKGAEHNTEFTNIAVASAAKADMITSPTANDVLAMDGSGNLTDTAILYTALATLTGSQTLTNKTLTSPILSGTVTGTYTLDGTPTVADPVISGTITGTYTFGGTPTWPASVAQISASQTLSNKSLTSCAPTSPQTQSSWSNGTGVTTAVTPTQGWYQLAPMTGAISIYVSGAWRTSIWFSGQWFMTDGTNVQVYIPAYSTVFYSKL